jgi:hypothetical protein
VVYYLENIINRYLLITSFGTVIVRNLANMGLPIAIWYGQIEFGCEVINWNYVYFVYDKFYTDVGIYSHIGFCSKVKYIYKK